MREDSIVEETRRARAKLFVECDENLSTLMNRLKEGEEQHKDRLVTIDDLRKRRNAEKEKNALKA